jgi:hypothetical protein
MPLLVTAPKLKLEVAESWLNTDTFVKEIHLEYVRIPSGPAYIQCNIGESMGEMKFH